MPWLTQLRVFAVLVTFIAVLAPLAPLCQAEEPMPAAGDAHYCSWWQARVAPAVKPKRAHHVQQLSAPKAQDMVKGLVSAADAEVYDPDNVTALTDEEAVAAIGCLFQLENDRRATVFGGGPKIVYVSQLFGPAPVKLAALLYISYLFTRNLNHFTAVALRGPGAESVRSQWLYVTSDEAIAKAYASYHRWFDEVKRIGLAHAREQNLSPLEGTGLWWY